MRNRPLFVATLVGIALLTSSCGGGSTGASAGARSVDIDMRDNAYSPDHVTVHGGETVRFRFHNTGAVAHDAFMGDSSAQDDHEMAMRSAGGMHGGADAVTVDPGDSATLTRTFHAGDQMLIGCHQTGHYAAAMKITVEVK